jgi:hypothetical protein
VKLHRVSAVVLTRFDIRYCRYMYAHVFNRTSRTILCLRTQQTCSVLWQAPQAPGTSRGRGPPVETLRVLRCGGPRATAKSSPAKPASDHGWTTRFSQEEQGAHRRCTEHVQGGSVLWTARSCTSLAVLVRMHMAQITQHLGSSGQL